MGFRFLPYSSGISEETTHGIGPVAPGRGEGAIRHHAVRDIAEVIDYETLLARDAETEARDGVAALIVRDRAIGAQSAEQHTESSTPNASRDTVRKVETAPTDAQRLQHWLAARRQLVTDLPGTGVRSSMQLIAWVMGLGALAGASSATMLLAYDGSTPVNVLGWLLYAVVVPVLMLVPLVVGLFLPAGWVRHGTGAGVIGQCHHPAPAQIAHK